MPIAQRIADGRLHYGWIVAAVTFLILLAASAIRATPGVLIVPLEQTFGWSRATVSFAISVNLLLYGLCGPFAAALMERLGVRRVIVLSLSLVTVGVALTTVMRTPWQLVLLWGVVVGIGTGATALVLAATVANRWFVARRGLVIGVLTASTATGQLLFLPLLATVVDHSGWRAAALLVAAIALAMVPVVFVLMRDQPRDLGLRAFGDLEGQAAPSVATRPAGALAALGEGARSRDFWLLSGSFFICGLSTNGLIGTHLIPASMDHGLPAVTAAGLLAAMGVFDLIGTTISGWLSDRWDNRRLLFWYYGLRGLSLMLLPYAYGSAYFGLTLFALFYGLDWVATVPPTVRLTETLFGKARVGIMYGWIAVAHQMGASTAAFGAGVLRTWLGSYQVAFTGAGFVCLIAAVMVLTIGQGRITVPSRRRAAEISGAVES